MGPGDYIGGRGESIAFSCLTRIWGKDRELPYFWPHYLGEKAQTLDYLVYLLDAGESTPFFFVQVKTTQKELTRTQTPPRLRVEVSAGDVRRMVVHPAPTYVIGVAEETERAFFISIHGEMGEAIPSITTAHELNGATLKRLWDEVLEFWRCRDMSRTSSYFLN
jgi:hypothetical protein